MVEISTRSKSRRDRCGIQPWISVATFTLIVFVANSFVGEQASVAQPPESCITTIRNVEGGTPSTLVGADPDQTGIRSTVHFGFQRGDCIRVSSLAVSAAGASADGSPSVEWGWVLGWHPSGPNTYSGSGACDDRYYVNPELFVVWIPRGGRYHCKDVRNVPTGSGGEYHGMSTLWTGSSGSTNFDFGQYFDGTRLTSISVNFYFGAAVTNGERHNLSIDTAAAEFDDLQKRTTQDPNSWASFVLSYCGFDNDPDFDWSAYSGVHTKVYYHSGAAC